MFIVAFAVLGVLCCAAIFLRWRRRRDAQVWGALSPGRPLVIALAMSGVTAAQFGLVLLDGEHRYFTPVAFTALLSILAWHRFLASRRPA